jgi:hypothetical protein
VSLYASLLADISQLPGGWGCVQSIDPITARSVAFTFTDAARREHIMRVKLPEDYPRSAPTSVQVDLPLPFDAPAAAAQQHAQAGISTAAAPASSSSTTGAAAASSSSTLCALYDRFSSLVRSCQLFWSVLRDLDEHAWVLEPDAPIPKSECRRKIVIGQCEAKGREDKEEESVSRRLLLIRHCLLSVACSQANRATSS